MMEFSGSKTHLGTFGTMTREAAGWKKAWLREEELTFLKVLGKKLPIGGEAVRPESAGVSGFGRERVVAELEKLNLTYLNRAYDRRLLELWEMESFSDSGIWREKSLLDYVGAASGVPFCPSECGVGEGLREAEDCASCLKSKTVGLEVFFRKQSFF